MLKVAEELRISGMCAVGRLGVCACVRCHLSVCLREELQFLTTEGELCECISTRVRREAIELAEINRAHRRESGSVCVYLKERKTVITAHRKRFQV